MSVERMEPETIDCDKIAGTGEVMAEEGDSPSDSASDFVRIKDGYYVLRSGTGERVLDIVGNSCSGDANAQLYHPNGTGAQVFSISWDKGAQATVISHAGLVLESRDGNVCQTEDIGTKAQRWLLEPVGGEDGWFFIRNLSGCHLDVDGASDADGTNVKCWEFNASSAQMWKPIPVSGGSAERIEDGEYVLRSATSKRVVEIEDDSSEKTANARLHRPNGSPSQLFGISWDEDAEAMAIRHAELSLDKEGGDGCGNVWQYADNGTKAQRWLFEPVDGKEGWYFIRNLFGYYLDVVDAADDEGLNVCCRTFDGSHSQMWKVEVPSLAYATATLSEQSFSFVGEAIEPAVTVTLGSRVLERDSDFDVSFKDNVEVGTATVKVFGKGMYKGTAKVSFEVTPASLGSATLTLEGQSFECTGGAVKPKVTVTLNGATLKKGADYAVSYTENVEPGTATVTVSGKGNYEGVASTTFEIAPERVSLKRAEVSFAKSSYVYTGAAIEPEVTVTLRGETLTRDVDYEVSYKDNENVGVATIEVSGKGSYKGTAKAIFKVVPFSIKKAIVTPEETLYAYTGDAIKPNVTVTLNGAALSEGADYSVSYADNVGAGTSTIKVHGKGNYKGKATACFQISPISLTTVEVTPAKSSYEYTGAAIKPKVTVTLDGEKLERGVDYAVSYTNNEVVGTATVTIRGKGNYEGMAAATFDILPTKVTIRKVTASDRGVATEWEAQSGVDGYQIQYADDAEFKHIKRSFVVVGALSTHVSVPELAASPTNYVRVRAYKDALAKRHYSSWGGPKKAKRK